MEGWSSIDFGGFRKFAERAHPTPNAGMGKSKKSKFIIHLGVIAHQPRMVLWKTGQDQGRIY
jgi:hypothetical protein